MSVTTEDLSGLALFDGCDADDLQQVMSTITGVLTLEPGEELCAEGDSADRWWIVEEGTADVTIGGLYIASIGPGESVGEMALLDGEPRDATVRAATELVLAEVDGERFLDVLKASSRLTLALLRETANRLRQANRRPRQTTAPSIAPAAPPVVGVGRTSQWDPRVPSYFEDPAVHLAALREQGPVHWSDELETYLVTRYEDVRRMCRDRALVGSVATTDPPHVPARRRGSKMMIRVDGSDHTRLRRLVSKVFTPKAIGHWEERSEFIVGGLLDDLAAKEQFDVMADFALIVPAQIISEMLGMPTKDMKQLQEWSTILTRGLDPFTTPEEMEAADLAGRAISEYTQAVITDKRAHPGDDILTALLEAQDGGDILDDEEVLSQVLLLYIAGHETTRNLIGNGLTHLFRFPQQLDLMRAEPALDSNAIEEVLRFESPAQLTRRVNHEPVEVAGEPIPAGSLITLSLSSANRDPRKWGPTADVLDVARPGANEHVSFGGGPHFCLGNALARLEARVALPALVRRFPRLQPLDDPQWSQRLVLRGVETLWVSAA